MSQSISSTSGESIDAPRLALFNPEVDFSMPAAPAKPRKRKSKAAEDLPLWQRKDGRWCRKIKGTVHYFGKDKEKALGEWARVKDDLLAGRTPRVKGDGLLLGDLCERFLN